MKILQIIDSLPATSGGSRFVVNLAKSLKNKGVTADVLLVDGKDSHFLQELAEANINVIKLDVNTSSRYKLKYLKMLAKAMSQYDIVHVHVFPASYLVAIASFLYRKNSPVVFTEHNAYNRRATNTFLVYFEKFIYKRFEKIVGITPEVKEFIHKYIKCPESKIEIIYNGVDADNLIHCPTIKREYFNLNDDDIVCLMAARFSDQKDHETLIKSFSKLPFHYKLLLAGDGDNLDRCKELVNDLNLNNRIQFLGSRGDVYSIIKMSDINILSSNYEGFGLSIVEAMTLSKPVIGTRVNGMDKIIEGAGLLFEVGDENGLFNHILKLGSNREFYNEVAQNCKKRASMFTLDTMTNHYLRVYKEVLDKK